MGEEKENGETDAKGWEERELEYFRRIKALDTKVSMAERDLRAFRRSASIRRNGAAYLAAGLMLTWLGTGLVAEHGARETYSFTANIEQNDVCEVDRDVDKDFMQSQTVTVSPTGQTTYANKTFSVTTCSKLTPFWEGLWMFTAIIGFGISAFGVFVIMTRNDR